MIFIINYNWVSTRWQWSVNSDTNKKGTVIYMTRNNTQNNTKTQNTRNRKENIQNKTTNIKRITKKNIKRVLTT